MAEHTLADAPLADPGSLCWRSNNATVCAGYKACDCGLGAGGLASVLWWKVLSHQIVS